MPSRWTASRGDSRTTHAIILTDSLSLLQNEKSGMGSPDWNVSVVDIHLRKKPVGVLSWTWREMTEQIDWHGRQPSQVACFSEDKCWGAWDTTCGHEAKDITPSTAWRRARQYSLKGLERAIINQSNTGTVSKTTLGKLLRDGVERICAFPSSQIPSWTELNCSLLRIVHSGKMPKHATAERQWIL